jgi:hypothetical protein
MAIVSAKSVFNKGKVKIVGSDNDAFQATQETQNPSFLESLWHGTKNLGSNIKKDLTQRGENIGQGLDREQGGQQNFFETALQTTGNVIGAGNDILGNTVSSLDSAIPESVKKLTSNPLVEASKKVVGKGVEVVKNAYDQWKETNPRAAADLEATTNILSVLPWTKGSEFLNEGKNAVVGLADEAANLGVRDSIGSGVESALKPVKNVADNVNISNKIEDIVTEIPKSVETELKKTSVPKETVKEKVTSYFDQAEKAKADNSQSTPLELAGEKATTALKEVDTQVKTAGEAKRAATQAVGKKAVGTIIVDSLGKLEQGLKNRFGGIFNKAGEIVNTKGRSLKIAESEKSLINTVRNKLIEIKNFPTVQRVDDAIDFIQRELYKTEKNLILPANKEVNAFLREVEGSLNRELKKVAGKAYADTNAKFSKLKFTRDELNKALGADSNKGASLMKQLFSPSGTASKKLFAEIKKLTGIDLVNEATFAKFAMESVGDARQASLISSVLEAPQILAGKSSLLKSVYDFGIDKIKNPKNKALRIVEKRAK